MTAATCAIFLRLHLRSRGWAHDRETRAQSVDANVPYLYGLEFVAQCSGRAEKACGAHEKAAPRAMKG
jgi:hypothetical protein